MTVVKIMQLYSDRQGHEVVSQAGARLRADMGVKKCGETVWNTELLRNAKLRMMAAHEATEADFVIIAAREGQPLTPQLRQWLQLWKDPRRQERRSTLIALLHRDCGNTPRTIERAFHAFARRAKMDFLCHSRVELKSERFAVELNLPFLA